MLQYVSAAQRHLPELDSNPLTVWNFYARFSDVISGGGGAGVREAVLTSRNVGCVRFSSDIELRMFLA